MPQLFKVFRRYSDTCGNVSFVEHGVYEANDVSEVEAVFRDGFFVGFFVEPLEIKPLPTTVQHVPAE